jgi:hypothetical protein
MKVIFKNFLKEDLVERLEFHQKEFKGLEPDTIEADESQTIIDLITKEINTRHESKNQ